MAITGVDGIVASAVPPEYFFKTLSGLLVAGRPFTPFYTAGIPGAAVAPSPGVNGANLTSYAGQLPFANPSSGNSYLGRFAGAATQGGILMLCDRLWHNSGLSVTSLSAQAISAGTLPARDNNGTTNGDGVLVGMEVTTGTGAGANVPTLTYTDQDGNTGATANLAVAYAASSLAGAFYPFALAAGDTGVRTPTSFINSVSMTSGAISLVAYRVLAALEISANAGSCLDPITGGLVRMYDDTVPFLLFVPTTTTSSYIHGMMHVLQG